MMGFGLGLMRSQRAADDSFRHKEGKSQDISSVIEKNNLSASGTLTAEIRGPGALHTFLRSARWRQSLRILEGLWDH